MKVLLVLYIIARLLVLLSLRGDPSVPAALARYHGQTARVVCYPVPYVDDPAGYAAASYAVVPAILIEPPCENTLSSR